MASSKQRARTREARDRLRRYKARQEVHAHQTKRRLRDNIFADRGRPRRRRARRDDADLLLHRRTRCTDPGAVGIRSAPPTGANVGAARPSLAENRTWTGTLTINGIALGIELDGANAPQATAGLSAAAERLLPGQDLPPPRTTERLRLPAVRSLDGTGAGDPGYSYGPIENAPADDVYPAGTIAMARSAGQRLQQRPPVLHRSPTRPPSAPTRGRLHRHRQGHERARQPHRRRSPSKGIDPEQIGADGQPAHRWSRRRSQPSRSSSGWLGAGRRVQ